MLCIYLVDDDDSSPDTALGSRKRDTFLHTPSSNPLADFGEDNPILGPFPGHFLGVRVLSYVGVITLDSSSSHYHRIVAGKRLIRQRLHFPAPLESGRGHVTI